MTYETYSFVENKKDDGIYVNPEDMDLDKDVDVEEGDDTLDGGQIPQDDPFAAPQDDEEEMSE